MAEEPIQPPAEEEEAGAPRWIVTFADMMSLLLCFFVLLLSFSNTDAEKFKAVADSLKKAFTEISAPIPGLGKPPAGTTPKPTPNPDTPAPEVITTPYEEQLEIAKDEIDYYIEESGLDEHIQTIIVGSHLKVVNSNPLNFPPGTARLMDASFEYLDMLLPVLQKFEFQIIVEGHTDDQPINTEQFRSNWELSAGRAASFVLYLEANGVDPRRLVVHGYGPNRPLADNETEENRAKNRRIEILLKEHKDDPEANAALAEVIDG